MKPMTADRFDNDLRWVVSSQENPGISYLVDLAEWRCNCRSFECVVGPYNKLHGTMRQCKHIAKACDRAGRLLLLKAIVASHQTEGRLDKQT